MSHICPWWGGYFIDNRFRRWLHQPEHILAPYLLPGMTALDFGCGMGMFAIAMAGLVGTRGRVIAVDVQPRMLDVLVRRAATAGLTDRIRAHLCHADAIGLDEPVDFALAFYSAHEAADMRRLFVELHGLLRPGGRLLVVEPILHVTRRAFARMTSLAEQIGFLPHAGPRIRLSRAAIFEKQPTTNN